jgi:hypothetical protein
MVSPLAPKTRTTLSYLGVVCIGVGGNPQVMCNNVTASGTLKA